MQFLFKTIILFGFLFLIMFGFAMRQKMKNQNPATISESKEQEVVREIYSAQENQSLLVSFLRLKIMVFKEMDQSWSEIDQRIFYERK